MLVFMLALHDAYDSCGTSGGHHCTVTDLVTFIAWHLIGDSIETVLPVW